METLLEHRIDTYKCFTHPNNVVQVIHG
jgi:hypothetical protein